MSNPAPDLSYADTPTSPRWKPPAIRPRWKPPAPGHPLRGTIDAGGGAEYKHVVLGLLFLKYISDSFTARRAELENELAKDAITGKAKDRLLESRDEYTANRVFWVPPEARNGRVYDPCCDSGGMFIQSEQFVAAHGGNNKPQKLAFAPIPQ
jgi:type I restriction-modification system DNA methylase subunit